MEFTKAKVVEAEDGKQGMELAQKISPDLIIMDLRMPVMDGYKSIRIMKSDANTQKISIVVVTASVREGQEDSLKRMGVDRFLRKPISKNELLEELFGPLPSNLQIKKNSNHASSEKVMTTANELDLITDDLRIRIPKVIEELEGKWTQMVSEFGLLMICSFEKANDFEFQISDFFLYTHGLKKTSIP